MAILSSGTEYQLIQSLQNEMIKYKIITTMPSNKFDSNASQLQSYQCALDTYHKKIKDNYSAADAIITAKKACSITKYRTSNKGKQTRQAYQASDKGKASNLSRQKRHQEKSSQLWGVPLTLSNKNTQQLDLEVFQQLDLQQ